MAIDCPDCGSSISEGDHECTHCGYPLDANQTYDARAKHVFLLGVIAMATFILPIVGIALGVIGLRRGYAMKDQPYAKEGVFFSIAAIFFGVALTVYSFVTGELPEID